MDQKTHKKIADEINAVMGRYYADNAVGAVCYLNCGELETVGIYGDPNIIIDGVAGAMAKLIYETNSAENYEAIYQLFAERVAQSLIRIAASEASRKEEDIDNA